MRSGWKSLSGRSRELPVLDPGCKFLWEPTERGRILSQCGWKTWCRKNVRKGVVFSVKSVPVHVLLWVFLAEELVLMELFEHRSSCLE